jgi:4'-phosphopantetheinyl transferase EntD
MDPAMTLISELLPPEVACAEQVGSFSGALLPLEKLALGPGARLKRRQEFTAGRTCARMALEEFGITDTSVLIGKKREPLWPEQIVGSITHCEGYCAAVVAGQRSFAALGVDAETNRALPEEVLSLVADHDEQRWLHSAPKCAIHWDRLLFSIKESVYKVWYPLVGTWLGFHDVRVHIEPNLKEFQVDLHGAHPSHRMAGPSVLRGGYLVRNNLLLTAIVLKQ